MSKKSRHIAILTLINPGHVNPTLGLCSELVARGHRVTYVTDDRHAERVAQSGAEPVVIKIPHMTNAEKIPGLLSAEDPRVWPIYASLHCPNFISLAAATVAEVESFYSVNVPDLIIYDRFSFAGRILAKQLGSPAIHLWATFAYGETLVRPNGVCLNPQPFVEFSHVLDSFMSAYGIEEKGSVWHTEKLGIYLIPKEFQYDIDSFDDDRYCFVGPCMKPARPVTLRGQNGGKPVVLVTSSFVRTENSLLDACIDAFADSDYHVVLSPGANSPKISADELPGNFELNLTAYNVDILPHASLIVCQTGMAITMESLYHGVPIIAIPQTPFHSEIAYRVAELGLGKLLPESRMTSHAIRACADEILQDEELLSRVKAMQTAIHRSGGAKLAADRIEGFLDG